MKSIRLISCGYIRAVAIMMAFIFAEPALSVCVDSDPPSDTILAIDANNGCADIQGQVGCTIKDPNSSDPLLNSCDFPDPITGDLIVVNSTVNTDGSLSWSLADSSLKIIDTAIVGGGSKGKNNCGYVYKYDVASGTGGDCKTFDTDGTTCLSYQNITSLDVCTDGITEEAPPPPPEPVIAKPLEYCQAPGSTEPGVIDETGIICPVEIDPVTGLPVIDPDTGLPVQKPVIVCNLEKDKYAWGATGSDIEGEEEQVCCQCGISTGTQTACFVSEDPEVNAQECAQTLTSDPTEEVILTFQKNGDDPCYTKYSGGKPYKVCW